MPLHGSRSSVAQEFAQRRFRPFFAGNHSFYVAVQQNHPLEGKLVAAVPCLTDEMERRFYGSNPVFIFDPQNDTNRPVMGIHTNAIRRWPLFPQFIRDAFVQAFNSDCIINPNRRDPENEWQKLFLRLRDQTVLCSCGAETFIEDGNTTCQGCRKSLGEPLRLRVNRHQVVMFPGQKTYNFHTHPHTDDFVTITGEVIQNKNNPNLWGLRNLSPDVWFYTMPDGTSKSIKNNEVVPIFKDITIGFAGGVKGEIV